MTRQLVSLKDDCEVEAGIEHRPFDAAKADAPALMELMHVLGFHRLRTEMAQVLGVKAGDAKAAEAAVAPTTSQAAAGVRHAAAVLPGGRPGDAWKAAGTCGRGAYCTTRICSRLPPL